MKPVFFSGRNSFRKWLEKNHSVKKEVIAGFYKIGTGRKSMIWSESVDEALCFGWIDGIRRKYDDESYTIRFTPRNPKSNWSLVNINKVKRLKKLGLMRPAGLKAYRYFDERAKENYSYEIPALELTHDYEKSFRKNKKAWDWFSKMPPSYRKVCVKWVMTAKQEATRLKRLNELIGDSEAGIKIKPMRIGGNK
ncbi:MAG: YdeI/OmpD-associated family protein [Bacteroidetes bacterium]|nr:YdeI/OmpD-associated family protein [Bacteroidota bacterium]